MAKVKVLFLAANPNGTPQLRIEEEIRRIGVKLRATEYRDSLELVSRPAVRPDDVLAAMLEVRPHIVHFSSHGGPASKILLHDQSGQLKPVGEEALVQLFTKLKDDVRVVFLNTCSTRTQAE